MSLREIPMVRLLAPLVVGMVVAPLWFFPDRVWISGVALVAILLLMLWRGRRGVNYDKRTLFGGWTHLFFFLLGTLLLDLNIDIHRHDHCQILEGKDVWCQGVIVDKQEGSRRLSLVVVLDSVSKDQGDWQAIGGRVQVYVPIDVKSNLLNYGQLIRFRGEIREVPAQMNPKAFDYRQYLRQQNVYNQVFTNEDDWRILDPQAGNSVLILANKWRNKSIAVLQRHLTSSNELAVGMALILGNKSAIDESLQAAYANTGAMHVLAVSGLHIGMVYLGLTFLLGLVPSKHRYWKWLKVLLTLLGVWCFALITGGSPSVLRAATMFSFLIVGMAFSRYTNIYNTLAASAFVLLCINPLLLRQVGFQLSYLAVLGIIYFQPRIYKKWYIKNRIGDYLWKLISVSLAAQITTFPLSLFYFHQFPLYFWLSGLIVVPGAVLILTTGLSLILLHQVPFLGWMLGKILYATIWLTNALIFMIQQLPAGLIKGIWIGGLSLFLMYVTIVFLVGFLEKKTAPWAIGGLISVCALLVIHNLTSWQRLTQQEITIYQVYKHTLIDLIDGKKAISLADETLDEEGQLYPAGNYRTYKGITQQTHFPINAQDKQGRNWFWKQQYLQFDTLRLAIIDQESTLPGQALWVDYVLLRNSPDYSVETLQKSLRFKALIFDGSNFNSRVDDWVASCKSRDIPYYNLPKEGALTFDLSHPQ